MRRALELAARGPAGANPRVGAVIADPHGRILGEGWHHGAGTPHAEPTAIADAARRGEDLRGARMLVTLEPCNHTGRTGPCSEAVVEAGLGSLVYAAPDRTPQARGGAEALRHAGLEVTAGLLEAESERLNRRWSLRMSEGRPFVTAKLATSLDYAMAAADGSSQWITSEESRRHAQSLRRRVDAILVGTGTVLADNPRLTAREDDGDDAVRQPLRVAVGLREVPAGAAIRGEDGRFRHVRTRDPREALRVLAAEGAEHVMLEGGPQLLGAFLDAGLVDETWHYLAPMLIPGGRAASARTAAASLSDADRMVLESVERIGPDVLLRSQTLDSPDRGGPASPAPPAQDPTAHEK
ncbi:bifunctional diaminohydroxyphosphoribosylaminopyrimidine deaminase/5-amino-6-(5-phosphoribosylamino)uracil reductase RibD [Arthrobacter sp. UM1]|nr:bifunctional diaminohydroxyphosphoribosylaminopyrimidine deaminase/5-amino-6-(5-phosphoribosylamino)uracil reductase RibD [Arthrobacter sp. UM1]